MGSVYGAHLQVQATEEIRANGRCGAVPFRLYMVFPPMTLDAEKKRMRAWARDARRSAHAGAAGAAAGRVKVHCLEILGTPDSVAGYWPMGAELDVRPLLDPLLGAGTGCALPVVLERGERLTFRRWLPGLELERGSLGTRHPGATEDEVIPDVILTPLLAFDGEGFRLGQGGGYYDRTIEALRREGTVLAVGVAYAAQRVDMVPRSVHDQRLDWMVTEEGAVRFA